MKGILRKKREQKGLTLRQVHMETGIPVDILDAIESDDEAQLAPGGFAARYRDQYARFLEVDPAVLSPDPDTDSIPLEEARRLHKRGGDEDGPAEPTVTDPHPPRRLPVGRMVLSGVALAAVGVLFFRVVALLVDDPSRTAGEDAPQAPKHELSVRAIEPSPVLVTVDGEVAYDSLLPAPMAVQFTGGREMAVRVPDLTRVRIEYDGKEVEPLGNLTSPRRLVFLDDQAP